MLYFLLFFTNPMKFIPTNQNFVFEPIDTPNKNIQSYFMRSEQSYFTPEALRYPKYVDSQDTVCFLVGNGSFFIDDTKIEQDYIVNDRFNIEKYGTRQKCIDMIYSILYSEIQKKNCITQGNIDSLRINGSQNNDKSINLNSVGYESDKSVQAVANDSENCDSLKMENYSLELTTEQYNYTLITSELKIQLVVSDFLCRSDTIAIIDIFLNALRFKCIMILPFSLCVAFNLNQGYSAYIHKNGFTFIDDFCLLDTYDFYPRNEKYEKVMTDDWDFAEEYSRLNILDESLAYSCDECGIKEETEEKIKAHSSKEHGNEIFFKFEKSNDFLKVFKDRMRYLFKREQLEKISTKVYSFDIDIPEVEKLDNPEEQALLGAKIFSNLEISKELWMTDCEWRNTRLRILKEKLLFYI